MLWDEPMQQGDALLLCEPGVFKVLPLLAGASPSFSSFLLEKLLLNNSVQLLSAPRAGAMELMLEEQQPVPSCWGQGKVHWAVQAPLQPCSAQGRLCFQLAFWQLLCPSGTLHEEQASCAPELMVLPDTSSA